VLAARRISSVNIVMIGSRSGMRSKSSLSNFANRHVAPLRLAVVQFRIRARWSHRPAHSSVGVSDRRAQVLREHRLAWTSNQSQRPRRPSASSGEYARRSIARKGDISFAPCGNALVSAAPPWKNTSFPHQYLSGRPDSLHGWWRPTAHPIRRRRFSRR
jgi:hypothetical protein